VAIPAHREKQGINIDLSFTSPGKTLSQFSCFQCEGRRCMSCVHTVVLFYGILTGEKSKIVITPLSAPKHTVWPD
jgi:hypothetical protein